MKKIVSIILLISSFTVVATASSIIMESGYIQVGVSDDGTFGVGGTNPPGILFDENGTGNYGVDDYLTPGSPWEFFTLEITADTNVTYTNNNASETSPEMPTSITGDTHQVTATSETPDGLLRMVQTYTLEEGSKVLKVDVTIENISDAILENVKYARGIDPDVDFINYDIFETNNTRGYDGSADGLPVFPVTDVVIAEGVMTKKVISLLYTGEFSHNTNIDSSWGVLPSKILEGQDDGYGDYTINLAIDLGAMEPGDVKEFSFDYVLGNDLPDLSGILPPPIEPVTLANATSYNDNSLTSQNGSAPAFNMGSILVICFMFVLLFYRKRVSRRS